MKLTNYKTLTGKFLKLLPNSLALTNSHYVKKKSQTKHKYTITTANEKMTRFKASISPSCAGKCFSSSALDLLQLVLC